MERRRFISDCVTKAADEWGYTSMKQEQLDVAIAFVYYIARWLVGRRCHTSTVQCVHVVVNHIITT